MDGADLLDRPQRSSDPEPLREAARDPTRSGSRSNAIPAISTSSPGLEPLGLERADHADPAQPALEYAIASSLSRS